jgi:hypothetical protein
MLERKQPLIVREDPVVALARPAFQPFNIRDLDATPAVTSAPYGPNFSPEKLGVVSQELLC